MQNNVAVPNLIGSNIESFQQTGIEQLEQTVEQIEQRAEEFEGLFVSLLIKELRTTSGEGGLFGGENSDSYGSLFDLFLGEHLAESRPLGIASIWLDQYRANQDPNSTTGDSGPVVNVSPSQPGAEE